MQRSRLEERDMADNPTLEAASPKKKGVKRRAFLIGGAAVAGAGIFALYYGDHAARRDALSATKSAKAGSFTGWLKIGEDDRVTLYTPHCDLGTGSSTALLQMAADELDADITKVTVVAAPVESAFANIWLAKGFPRDMMGLNLPDVLSSMVARNVVQQITGGSSAVRMTGQMGVRVMAAAARGALIAEAAQRLGVPASELTTANGTVSHAKSGKSLRYGELAVAAAERDLAQEPKLKSRDQFTQIGKPVRRTDIPAKVDGSAQYGIDFTLPGMRVATVMAAPVRGGKLESVDPAPAMAVKGVEKVVKLDDAVAVVAKGYWAAISGLRALAPKFSDGGNGGVSTATLVAAQDKTLSKADAFDAGGGRLVEATYRTPYLHHAMMEPFALTALHKGGKLDVWGGLQDPLASRYAAADAAGLNVDDVTFHQMLLGGGFGRKLPGQIEIIPQVVKLAMESEYPVKLIWSREEEVRQGTYRPQTAAAMKASLDKQGKITAWRADFTRPSAAAEGQHILYNFADQELEGHTAEAHIETASFRSVDASQHAFYVESFMDEAAQAAGVDAIAFRKRHLAPDSSAAKLLDAVAKASDWGTPLPKGTGRGVAIYECFGTRCAQVVQASVDEDGYPKVEKVWAAVDCGLVVNPLNAEAQVMGGIVMGLSTAIHEEITIDQGAVVQSSFPDYPLLKMAETPEISIAFLNSNAPIGGLGEPGLPPAAPALANALFAATGKRIRQLPIKAQAAG
jgi:isoquinoline 1-oxidoreductase subunit beta